MKRRILYVLHAYYNRAGTEQHTKDLAETFAPEWECWFAFRDREKLCLRAPDASVEEFPSEAPVWPLTPYRQPATEASLQKMLARVDPQIIHLQHFIFWPLSVIDMLTASDKPVVLSFHDYYSITPLYTMQGVKDPRECVTPEYAQRVFGADVSPYLIERQRVLAKSFAAVRAFVTPSEYTRDEITKIYPLAIQVIEHGIKPFEALPRRHSFLQDQGLIFGHLGSLLPQKGWEFLLRAFAEVHRELPATQLHFYGGAADVAAELSEGVTFFGPYEQRDIPSLLSSVDVGIIPSLFPESFSLTLSELWQAQVPVAAAAIGAFRERIRDGVNGKLFPSADVQALASVLRWFVQHKEWREWRLPAVRSISDMAADYARLYAGLLA